MARPKEFDQDTALEAALGVFREHGYAATSAGMLTEAMNIGRQSLYDTFGDKWQLYRAAVQRYGDAESRAHLAALATGPKAIDGLRAMMARVVAEAHMPCLGLGSLTEFGVSREELNQLHAATGRVLSKAIAARIAEAQRQGDVPSAVNAQHAAAFLLANVAGIRMAARGGAEDAELHALARFALQALH
ncbi:TetR/AcrR family transcriptional regulator [Duganella callida]|uniref:TetR/AcrR family transcriptional regulator n=1 Tax=Duganella callida TaxID=2561932 RepID=A0A4Y9SN96_9BURK|nr:TetR/AcrR family transcriptional regulator [Duganella callida]TFW24334.1 TetR/AcrR family transcriptional regulator [Duganella callida]